MIIQFIDLLNSYYHFTRLGSKKIAIANIKAKEDLIRIHQFKFKTDKNIKYNVDVHEYRKDIFIAKFYQKKYESNPHKFNFLTNCGTKEASKVFRTMIEIFLFVLKKNENISIGFIGAHVIADGKEESKENTKRFRLYKIISANMVASSKFKLHYNSKKSAVFLVNKNIKNQEKFIKSAQDMFHRNYNNF